MSVLKIALFYKLNYENNQLNLYQFKTIKEKYLFHFAHKVVLVLNYQLHRKIILLRHTYSFDILFPIHKNI